jgi:hypothetical protein
VLPTLAIESKLAARLFVVVFVRAVFHAVDAAFDDVFGFFRGMIDRCACAFAGPARVLIAMTRRHQQSHADETDQERITKLVSQRVVLRSWNERIDEHAGS